MAWWQLHLVVDRSQAPLVELLFNELGALSVTLRDAADEPLLEPAPGSVPLWQQTCVTGLFPGDDDSDRLRGELQRVLDAELSRRLRLERLADQPWERAWLRDFRPMRFGRRLWICPAGQRPAEADGLCIDLDPGLAFGTGTHPTTALCLRWLDAHPPQGLRVLDFGCGSGVLALAALRLGAARVIAVDHDPQALQATVDNATRNQLEVRLSCHAADRDPGEAVDLVLANILAATLIELRSQLAARLRSGGRVVLSGILADQATEVAAAYAEAFEMGPPEAEGDWVLLAGRRR